MSDLFDRMMKNVEKYSYPENPIKRNKEKKRPPKYFFISTQFFEHKDPVTGVVSIKKVGFTYRKDKEDVL